MREHSRAGSVLAAPLLILAGLIALGGFLDLFGKPGKATAPDLQSSAPTAARPNDLLAAGLFSWPPPWPAPAPAQEPLPADVVAEPAELPPAVDEPTVQPTVAPTEAPPVPAVQPPAMYADYALASGAIDAVNAARAANGLGPVALNGALSGAAQSYAQYLTETDQFTHDALGGLLARVRAAGYAGGYAGEAMWEGWGVYSAGEVVNDLLNSPPHRAILLSAVYTEIGAGCYVIDNNGAPNTRCVLDVGAP
jgi:uncharacterized protein YkwD